MSGATVALAAEAARSLAARGRGAAVGDAALPRSLDRSEALRHLLHAGRLGRPELN